METWMQTRTEATQTVIGAVLSGEKKYHDLWQSANTKWHLLSREPDPVLLLPASRATGELPLLAALLCSTNDGARVQKHWTKKHKSPQTASVKSSWNMNKAVLVQHKPRNASLRNIFVCQWHINELHCQTQDLKQPGMQQWKCDISDLQLSSRKVSQAGSQPIGSRDWLI